MHIQENKITRISFGIAISIVTTMVIVFLYDYHFQLELYRFGLLPRNISGLLTPLKAYFILFVINSFKTRLSTHYDQTS